MKSDIYWDRIAELWICRTCKTAWLRMAISRCKCEDAPLLCWKDGVN